jgi:hypothetical protein
MNLIDKTRLLTLLTLIISSSIYSQTSLDSAISKIDPERLSNSIEKKVSSLENKIIGKSEENANTATKGRRKNL